MKRQPVKRTPTAQQGVTRVLGIDPGFASIGVCVLEQDGAGCISLLAVGVLETKKLAGKKHNTSLRVSADDSRRIKEIWKELDAMAAAYDPSVMAMEWYMPRGQNAGGWKAVMTVGVAHSIAMQREMYVLTNLPQDIKRAFGLSLKASKDDIADAVCDKVSGLRQALETTPKRLREHISDAVAHAYLAYAQVAELRQLMGV